MKVKIASAARQQILLVAEQNPDQEVCGLLVGREDLVEQAIPAANVAADPRRTFEIDPVVLLGVHRQARESGRLVLGHYHSHPGGRATPSLRDAASAYQDGALWIIVGEGGAIAGFRAERGGEIAGRFAPVALELS